MIDGAGNSTQKVLMLNLSAGASKTHKSLIVGLTLPKTVSNLQIHSISK